MTAHPHVFFAGRWVSAEQAAVPIGSLAMRYALSVFEGVRVYTQRDGTTPRPFRLGPHLDRLVTSLELMRLPDPGVATLPDLVEELIERNAIDQDAYVRVAVTPTNPGDLGTPGEPVLSVTAAPMGRKRWLARDEAMSVSVSDHQRASAAAFPPAAKNISGYAGARLAWLAARDAGFDSCVLTNAAGRLCEAPTASVFLVRDGGLETPALSEDVLPSITRAWVLDAARAAGIPIREAELTRADAYAADEAFLCGTGIEIAPVRAFDGRPCRRWEAREVTRDLVARYFAAARGGPAPGSADGDPVRLAEVTG